MNKEYENRCKTPNRAIQDTLEVIGGKWKIPILGALLERKFRFKELGKFLDISPRMLSKELQELEMNHLVTRTVCNTKPITVEYDVTPHGQTLRPVIVAMVEWGAMHRYKVTGRETS